MPKPRAYPRVERATELVTEYKLKNISFQYPTDAKFVEQYSEKKNALWFNMEYPKFEAKLYCTFLEGEKRDIEKSLDDNARLIGQALSMSSHTKMHEEAFLNDENSVFGRLYSFNGNAINPFQFYLTDSTNYFLRGALYYDTEVKDDSIALITESLKDDIVKLMETFNYKSIK